MKKLDTEQYSIQELTNLFQSSAPEEQVNLIGAFSIDPRQGARDIIDKHIRARERLLNERQRFESMLKYERELWRKGYNFIAGADEAGRGALAGPLVAGAVILPADFYLGGLKDSKKLSRERREEFFDVIAREAIAWAFELIPNDRIDDEGIQRANVKALANAVGKLATEPDYVLTDSLSIDGHIEITCKSLIRGDSLSATIAAASIVAKVVRDRIMFCLHDSYPGYDFKQHVGYGTAAHFEAINKNGISMIHRKTFLRSN